MKGHQIVWAVLAAALLLVLAPATAVRGGTAEEGRIEINDFAFAPKSLTIKAGSAVTWENKDDEPHTVVSDSGVFRSAAMDTGEKFTFKFDKPGTYHYACSIHPRMVGTIVVE